MTNGIINALLIFRIVALSVTSISFIVCAALAQYEIWSKRRNGITRALRNTSVTTAIFLVSTLTLNWSVLNRSMISNQSTSLYLLIIAAVAVVLLGVTYAQLAYYVVKSDG